MNHVPMKFKVNFLNKIERRRTSSRVQVNGGLNEGCKFNFKLSNTEYINSAFHNSAVEEKTVNLHRNTRFQGDFEFLN